MNFNPKKLLLAGTALVAAGAFVPMVMTPAFAADEFTIDADDSGTFTATGPDETVDTAVDLGTYVDHDIQFNGNASTINVANGEVIGLDADTTIAGITASASGNDATGDTLTITNDVDDATAAITIEGGVSKGDTTGFNLSIVSRTEDSDNDESLTVDIQGNVDLGTGTLLLDMNDANNGAQANDVAVSIDGNITAGAITLDADTTNEGTVTDVNLTLDGTTAQTVAAAINGGAANEGRVTVTNTHASGVTFTGIIGATAIDSIIVNNDGNNQAVAFTANVTTNNGITLGDNSGTDTVTATFGGAADTTVAGAVAGGGAADTVALVFTGGNKVTLSGAATANIDTVAVTGTGTTLDSDAAITATTVTVGAGTTLDQGAGLITAAIANSGTLHFTGTGGVTGDITGTGTLNVDANNTITGSIAATSIALAEAADLTVTAAAGARTLAANIAMEDAAADGTDATLALVPGANGIDVTGNITTAIDGEGEITIADGTGAVDFVGDIGTSALKVGALTVAGTSNNTITTTGNYHVTTTTLDDADNFQFLGTTAQAVSGTFVGAAANDGVITVGNGTTTSDVTFTGVIGTGAGNDLGALTVSANAKATFDANATFDGLLTANNATIEVGHGDTLTTNTQTDADVTTWNIQVNKVGGGAQTHGQVAFSGDAVNLAVDTVNFDVQANSAPLTVGASVLDNVFAGNAAATIAGATVTDNSFIYGFELVADTNNVDVTVTQANSIENTVSNGGFAATGNQLITTLAASTNTQINQLQSTLAAASTRQAANDVIEAAASDVSGGAVIAGVNVATQTSSITNTRLAALRSGETGMNAGEVVEGMNAWIQGFGSQGDQDDRDGVSGYDADTYGIAVGIDTEKLADDVTVGLSFAYASTDVESDAISNADTDVDSYQLSLYGDIDLDENTFVTGQLGYMWSENDTTRTPGGIAGLTANGSYDSDSVVVGAALGRNYATGHGSLVVTPTVSANYMHYSADSYTETGAGGANLTVDSDSLNMFEVGLGVDAKWDIENADGSRLMPSLGLGVRHDLIGDEFEATNQFAGGGTAFKVEGADPASTTFDAGLGVKYQSTSNWTLSADYNFEYKSDYSANAGMVKAAFQF